MSQSNGREALDAQGSAGLTRPVVWLLAGTTEGRLISESLLEEGVSLIVTVATDAGADILTQSLTRSSKDGARGHLDLRIGRLGPQEMSTMLAIDRPCCVVDATHPYAVEVSANAWAASASAGVPYLRFDRPAVIDASDPALRFSSGDPVKVARAAAECGSTVLLTTGSKLLAPYIHACRSRQVAILARVLDDPGAIEAAMSAGLSRDEIILFSPGGGGATLTPAFLHDKGISAVVMKDSGGVGGSATKLVACREAGVPVFLLSRSGSADSRPDIHGDIHGGTYSETHSDIELIISAAKDKLLEQGPPQESPRPFGATLMVQGTASNVGKSVLVAGLLRLFRRRGLRVAPFKAQNMSLNSGVTADGGEIGRAQMLQALAAGVEATTAMNPVLLKPQGDQGSQVVVEGKPWKTLRAAEFYQAKSELWPAVTRNLDRLRAEYDVVVIEGAGSPAEVNLRSTDIVNMAVALYADSPVLLVGDIDRGGVFAAIHGTLDLISPEEKDLVKGIVINKFRGDIELLRPGLDWLEVKTGVPVAGVIPWQPAIGLPEEDSLSGSGSFDAARLNEDLSDPWSDQRVRPIDVAVLRLPLLSNFTDIDALSSDPRFRVRWVTPEGATDEPMPDLLVIPGTKTTIDDLAHLVATGADEWVQRVAASGRCVLGICGGYQMLGASIEDPTGAEAAPGARTAGLSLLPVNTVFSTEKSLTRDGGFLASDPLVRVEGYQIHMGRTHTSTPAEAHPAPLFLLDDGASDGAILPGSSRGWVAGTYLHGVFDHPGFRDHLFASVHGMATSTVAPSDSSRISHRSQRSHQGDLVDLALDRLADLLEESLDPELLESLLPHRAGNAAAPVAAAPVRGPQESATAGIRDSVVSR